MKFDTKSTTYEAKAHVQRELAAWLAEWLEPVLPEDTAILEVGAGTGLFTRELTALGPITALDCSQAMIDEGRQHLPGVDWRTGNAFGLPAACCDRLYSSSLLQWATDTDAVARNWSSALKPDGRMLHGIFVAPTLPELAEIDRSVSPVYWRTTEEWLRAFAEAGLEILRWEQTSRVQKHPSAHALLRELHDTGVTRERALLGPGRLMRLMKNYESLYGLPEGGVRSTWSLLRVEAAK